MKMRLLKATTARVNIHVAVMQFAAERQRNIDATATRVKADAAAAEERLQEFARAGTEPWSAFNAALAQTRAVVRSGQSGCTGSFRASSKSIVRGN
jgi:hypothetical protein